MFGYPKMFHVEHQRQNRKVAARSTIPHKPQNRASAARTGTGFLRMVYTSFICIRRTSAQKWAAADSVFNVLSGPRWRSRHCNIPAHGGGAGVFV